MGGYLSWQQCECIITYCLFPVTCNAHADGTLTSIQQTENRSTVLPILNAPHTPRRIAERILRYLLVARGPLNRPMCGNIRLNAIKAHKFYCEVYFPYPDQGINILWTFCAVVWSLFEPLSSFYCTFTISYSSCYDNVLSSKLCISKSYICHLCLSHL